MNGMSSRPNRADSYSTVAVEAMDGEDVLATDGGFCPPNAENQHSLFDFVNQLRSHRAVAPFVACLGVISSSVWSSFVAMPPSTE